jgi:hypothetical protein
MQVEVDSNSIFTSPFDSLEEIPVIYTSDDISTLNERTKILLPGNVCQEWFISTGVDSPKSERYPDIIQASPSNFREVLFSLVSVSVI